jgi:hypothetical protein
MMIRSVLVPLLVAVGVVGLVAGAARSPLRSPVDRPLASDAAELGAPIRQVDGYLAAEWERLGLEPAASAPELQVLRRLSLALQGTIPSLQEIREFEADAEPERLARWTERMLSDRRFADYFAERLTRGYVGTEQGQFVIFRRDRFRNWLSEQIAQRVPYNQMVAAMISNQGLWTGEPATNFISAAVADGNIDYNKLAGRSVRAFLGQRIDCAQCHDHPFDDWKQQEFQGLTAFYGQVRVSIVGIEDKGGEYEVEDRKTLEKSVVPPSVPFHAEWLPSAGTRREKFAAWVTHPENRRFERAIANRVWGLLFGRAYVEPVDGMPNPPGLESPDLLDILGRDFREHDYDLRRLVRVIVGSRAFRLDSAHGSESEEELEKLKAQWAVFPLTRLRPEQIIGSILQSSSITTVDQNSHLVLRFIRLVRENDFVKEYGDLGDDELLDHSGTIPQALLRMNGKLVGELVEAGPLSASGRIAGLAKETGNCIDTTFLVCLTRRPTPPEREYFFDQFKNSQGKARTRGVEDLFWSMFNSSEFCWNH